MEFKWSWKYYNDEWNSEIFNLDSNNKNEIILNTDTSCNNKLQSPPTIAALCISPRPQLQLQEPSQILPPPIPFVSLTSKETIIQNINDLDLIYNCDSTNEIVILKNILRLLRWLNKNNSKESIQESIKAITWIKNKFKIFSDKLNLAIMQPRLHTPLSRSSYKLCTEKHKCINYYTYKRKCKMQHFPYNNLYVDCISILHYLTTYDNKKEYNKVEISKSINTIVFVTDVIVRELENA